MKIDDFRGVSELQSDYQKISFALRTLWLNTDQNILSRPTKTLILSNVSKWATWDYSWSREKENEIYTAIHKDSLNSELLLATSTTYRHEILQLLWNN